MTLVVDGAASGLQLEQVPGYATDLDSDEELAKLLSCKRAPGS
jgi:hypothetical protein